MRISAIAWSVTLFAFAAYPQGTLAAGPIIPTVPETHETTDADRAAAKTAYGEVERLWATGDFEGALVFADQAYAAVPNASVAILRATLHEKLGRHQAAFEQLLLAAVLDPTADEREAIIRGLAKHGAACSPPLGWVRVKATHPASPEPVTVTLGANSFHAPLTIGLPLGQHELRASAPGHQGSVIQLSVSASSAHELSLELAPLPIAPPKILPAPKPKPIPSTAVDAVTVAARAEDEEGDSQLLPWMLLGGGVAVAAAGVGMHVWALDAADQTDKYAVPIEGMPDSEREKKFDSANEDMQLRGALAYACYGVGAAAAVAGGVLLVLDATSDVDDTSVALVPGALPGGGAFFLTGEF